ncbi:MAG TPA: metal-dependent hydrolase [Candidatus Acidoferrales bacterium]
MEPFTHAFTSLAIARAGGRRLPRFGTAMLVVSGLAADLDYASYFGGAGAFMRFHRTALHSVAGSAVVACVVAGAFCLLDRRLPAKKHSAPPVAPLAFGAALAVSAVGAAGHVLLDVASGVGVQLLWPFHAHWSAWNLINELDLWTLLLLVVGLLLPLLFILVNEEVGERRKGPGGSRAAIVTLALLAAYFGARADLHSRALDLILSREYHGRIALSAAAFPESSAPFTWRGIAETDNTVEEVDVPLSPGDTFDPDRSVTLFKPEDSAELSAGERSAAARKFLLYARFPFARVQPLEAGYRVEVRDLRFADDDNGPANIVVRVDFNSALQITHEGFYFASSPDN